jgi:hypothetical protein
MLEKNDIWLEYKIPSTHKQEYTSKNTARMQMPRVFRLLDTLRKECLGNRLLDIGCGNKNQLFKASVEKLGFLYFGCDLFNKSKSENLQAIKYRANGQSDVVVLSNVLNTIKEEEVRLRVLRQCENALAPRKSLLIISVYEGALTSLEKIENKPVNELTPIKTRDGWQNRFKTERYLEQITSVFPNTLLLKTQFGKFVLSTKDNEISLKTLIRQAS